MILTHISLQSNKNDVMNLRKDPWSFTKKFRHVRQDVFNKITECEIGCFVTVTIVTSHDQLVTKLLTGGSLTGTKTNWIYTN